MSQQIDHLLNEDRRFAPSPEFAKNAIVGPEIYDDAKSDRVRFWGEQARELLHWHKPFSDVLDWSNPPFAKWFGDGELNVAYNCLDRHVEAGRGDRVAYHFEGEPGDTRTITYAQLTDEVKRLANVLTELGVGQGDRVAVYLPMIPEAIASLLAIARLGAVHSVVFGGFSADSLRARIDDAGAKVVITADGGYRKGRPSALKVNVDEALSDRGEGVQATVEKVLVVRRTEQDVEWTDGRDLWWHDVVPTASADHEAQPFPSENPLFILYTSGTTGRPKGILHTSGGYLTQAAFTHKTVFDLHAETDVFWCTADIGWVTGHTYATYAPLANGATQVLYEGTPEFPEPGRWWDLIEKYGVTIFYTAPTAVRSFMKQGREIPQKRDLSSIRLLGSVGEPINPEAWMWFRDVIGAGVTPVVDTWWQTETGAIMISALPGVTETKPGSAQVPVPGIAIDVVDEKGDHVGNDAGGLLVATEPWPAMLRGIWGDPDRFVDTYWRMFADKGYYFAGDGARRDADGDVWLLGRVDDVMNISGHRLSTAEIESALVAHEATAEAAVVGGSDETTGQAVVAFVILKESFLKTNTAEGLAEELRAWVGTQIGAIARPRDVYIVGELPKTRSGKIMRRLLRDVAEGREVGDTQTLADTSVMSVITKQVR